MAIQRAKDLLDLINPSTEEIEKSIAALRLDSEYVRKCVNANLRERAAGEKVIEEISTLIERLEKKLKSITN
jgi:hypothetical protein